MNANFQFKGFDSSAHLAFRSAMTGSKYVVILRALHEHEHQIKTFCLCHMDSWTNVHNLHRIGCDVFRGLQESFSAHSWLLLSKCAFSAWSQPMKTSKCKQDSQLRCYYPRSFLQNSPNFAENAPVPTQRSLRKTITLT